MTILSLTKQKPHQYSMGIPDHRSDGARSVTDLYPAEQDLLLPFDRSAFGANHRLDPEAAIFNKTANF